ncbi:hypothetical protein A2W57_03230 [Candidatus Giovannonibacteria bacterium RIFCSPHIGHO2_02_43_16]|nr:MAG: hypothetical protein A2W57_03230 [Candidatus Giovannonibacteria bacterium RIFCSPHIGHO2_02_43_16]
MYHQFYPRATQNYLTQRDGHLAALQDDGIQKMLISQRTFVRVILWAGSVNEIVPIFQGRMETLEDISRLSEAIRRKVPDYSSHSGKTDHFTPLVYAESVPLSAKRRIIDISTDQEINPLLTDLCRKLKDKLNREMKTEINVLAIGVDKEGVEILSKNLLTPKGFIEQISSWKRYIPAIKRKIVKELKLI